MNSNNIYLDYAAATPVDKRVLAAMLPYFTEKFYNPSAAYLPAKHLRGEYETQKGLLANAIGAKAPDLIITGGATESINLAFTVLKQHTGHCLISSIEHAAVRESARSYSAGNFDEVKVSSTGLVDLADLRQKIKEDTVLISIALVNNELGTIQPLSEINRLLQEVRESRLKEGNLTPLYLHSDASQAMSLLDLSVARLGVDLLTINAAKVYGPKGIGALYVARGVKLSPVTFGGGQEMGLRSGTENVPALIGFATAAKLAKEHLASSRRQYQDFTRQFKQIIEQESQISPLWLGDPKHQLVNFVPVCFKGLDAERLIFKLEDQGVYLSTGAACAASKGQKSHVLSAIGLSDQEIAGSLRVTFGQGNQLEDVKKAAHLIAEVVNQEAKRLRLVQQEYYARKDFKL